MIADCWKTKRLVFTLSWVDVAWCMSFKTLLSGHSSLKVLEIFSIFKALESPWKRIWCLKVLEFDIRGRWKCLNSETVDGQCYVKNDVVIAELPGISNIINVSIITYWLDAVKAVSHAENWWNRFGKNGEGTWKSLISSGVCFSQNIGHPDFSVAGLARGSAASLLNSCWNSFVYLAVVTFCA